MATSFSLQPPGLNQRANPIVLSLSDFELDRPILTAHEPITGSFSYEMIGEPPAYCLRLDYQLGLADATSWNCPEQILARSGRFRFAFNRLADSGWPSVRGHHGPAAVFLRVCTLPLSGGLPLRRPISNTCGTLVQVM